MSHFSKPTNSKSKPLAPSGAVKPKRKRQMTREQLTNLYMVWVNDFLTIGGFADHFGLTDSEAEMLLAVARSAYENPHPEA